MPNNRFCHPPPAVVCMGGVLCPSNPRQKYCYKNALFICPDLRTLLIKTSSVTCPTLCAASYVVRHILPFPSQIHSRQSLLQRNTAYYIIVVYAFQHAHCQQSSCLHLIPGPRFLFYPCSCETSAHQIISSILPYFPSAKETPCNMIGLWTDKTQNNAEKATCKPIALFYDLRLHQATPAYRLDYKQYSFFLSCWVAFPTLLFHGPMVLYRRTSSTLFFKQIEGMCLYTISGFAFL